MSDAFTKKGDTGSSLLVELFFLLLK